MVKSIHHATTKKAEKLGFIVTGGAEDEVYTVRWPERGKQLVALDASQGVADMSVLKMLTLEYPKLVAKQDGNDWELFSGKGKNASLLGSGKTLQAAWNEALDTFSEGDDEPEDAGDMGDVNDEEGADEDTGKSIIKRKYKTAYKPFKMRCGDELSKLISEHLMIKDEDGRMRIDPVKLVKFARVNNVWIGEYSKLNIGQQRMNIANRLRAKVRRDAYEIIWN